MSRDTIRLPHDATGCCKRCALPGTVPTWWAAACATALLGRMPGDWDICTSARPDEMRALFHDQRMILIGEKHGNGRRHFARQALRNDDHRLDGSYRDHRHPDSVQFVGRFGRGSGAAGFHHQRHGLRPRRGIIDLLRRPPRFWRQASCGASAHLPTALPMTRCAFCGRCGFPPSWVLRWMPPPPKLLSPPGRHCTPSAPSGCIPNWTACCRPARGRLWHNTARF